ncbi:MAG TPA: hypothetical protein VGR52_12740 [Stellaceae bacterium]|nr:hypothetical protein [Stellaceae bacterium]
MALTREAYLRLEKSGLVDFFDADRAVWIRIAQKSYSYLREIYPADEPPRPEDVSEALELVLSTNETLIERLDRKRLPQKFFKFFADLVIDREWPQIQRVNQ